MIGAGGYCLTIGLRDVGDRTGSPAGAGEAPGALALVRKANNPDPGGVELRHPRLAAGGYDHVAEHDAD